MRIPSSSSVILASLAVASSSSSLSAMAAPTSDGTGLVDPSAMSAADNSSDGGIQSRDTLNIGGLLEGLPVVGPALTPLVDILGLGSASGPAALASLPADKLAVAQSVANTAAANIQAAVKGATANAPKPVAAAAPPAPPQGGSSSSSSASSTSSEQPTSSPPPGGQPVIAMFSPPLPVNPPNTPVVRMVGLPEGRATHDAVPALEESDIHASISVGKGSSTGSAAPTSSSA